MLGQLPVVINVPAIQTARNAALIDNPETSFRYHGRQDLEDTREKVCLSNLFESSFHPCALCSRR